MGKNKLTGPGTGTNQASQLETNAIGIGKGARRLTVHELAELRRNMAESSAKMRTELARRRNDCPTQQGL